MWHGEIEWVASAADGLGEALAGTHVHEGKFKCHRRYNYKTYGFSSLSVHSPI